MELCGVNSMKKLKNLTRNQKKFLSKEGLDPKDFKVERETSEEYVFYNIHTGMLWPFYK